MDKAATKRSKFRFRELTLNFEFPKVMGILNVTPDSFSDGGKFLTVEKGLQRVGEMIDEGAAIIDVGGESTRPGSDAVPEDEELNRVIPLLQKAISQFPETVFSVDTTKYTVAKEALEAGVHIVNDVSGLRKEPRLARLCAGYGAGYVLMHSQGDPKTMQKNPVYDDVIEKLSLFFGKKITELQRQGVESVIIDPGIGFGKTLNHNLRIVAGLKKFTKFKLPVLAGASRKSMIGHILGGRSSEDRLAGTLAVHYHCLINGARLLRVHDVKEAADSVRVFYALQNS